MSESQEGLLQILVLVDEPWHEALLMPHLGKSEVQSALQISSTKPMWFNSNRPEAESRPKIAITLDVTES